MFFFGCLVVFFRLTVGCGFGGVCLEDVEVLKDEVVSWQILREFAWGL